MRRTGTVVRGRRLAAALAAAGIAVGFASPTAYGVSSIRAQEWHLDSMHASEMWQTSTGAGVTVAIVDSGVKEDHPDLVGQILPGKDFSGEGGTTDNDGHGTRMAGMIAGTGKGLDGQGDYGLAPGVKILPLKTNTNGNGDPKSSGAEALQQIDQAISYAADQGAKLINISQGIPQDSLTQSDLAGLKTAVDHANSLGSLVIAGVGNSGSSGNPIEYPGAMPGVVGVAAVGQDGKSTSEAEHGSQVVLAAPGMDIYASCTGPSGYCKSHGTSDASALTSASAALLWSVHKDWTANQVLRVLINTAGKPQDGSVRSDYIGYGIVRPRVALSTPGDPGPANVSPLAGAAGAGGSSGASTGSGNASGSAAPVPVPGAGSATASKSGSSGLLLIVGGIAVVVLLVVVLVVVLVLRRNRTSAAGPVAVGYPAQPPYGGGPVQQYGQQPPPSGGFPPNPGPTPPPGNPYQR